MNEGRARGDMTVTTTTTTTTTTVKGRRVRVRATNATRATAMARTRAGARCARGKTRGKTQTRARANDDGDVVTVMVNGVSGKMGHATACAVVRREGFELAPYALTKRAGATADVLGVEVTGVDVSVEDAGEVLERAKSCLLYTSPSPRDKRQSRMPSSA